MSKKSDLPFGSEFSPSQIKLPRLLELVEANQGNPRALEADILAHYFTKHGQAGEEKADKSNRRTLAMNCRLGLIAYQIIDREAQFTTFG